MLGICIHYHAALCVELSAFEQLCGRGVYTEERDGANQYMLCRRKKRKVKKLCVLLAFLMSACYRVISASAFFCKHIIMAHVE